MAERAVGPWCSVPEPLPYLPPSPGWSTAGPATLCLGGWDSSQFMMRDSGPGHPGWTSSLD